MFIVIVGMLQLAALIDLGKTECCETFCYAFDEKHPQMAHFGSKTSYSIARESSQDFQYFAPNCEPVKAWMFIRHGARLPEDVEMMELAHLEDLRDEIIKNYEEQSEPKNGALCDEDLDLLRQWSYDLNITTDKSEYLATEGWNDLKYLAKRLQRRFPDIFEKVHDEDKVLFRHTKVQRTERSFKAFVEGLYGPDATENVYAAFPPKNDTLLKAQHYCPAYKRIKAMEGGSEYQKFLNSDVMMQLVYNVSMRLGFRHPLSPDQIATMFNMCQYEFAWYPQVKSPWCVVFTPSQVEVLEYLEDLSKYYKSSYGTPVNRRIQCTAVNDMLHHIESDEYPNLVAYFSHFQSLVSLLTALKAFYDPEPLRADNFYSMTKRKFRMSEIAPFAANLMALKLDCQNDVEPDKIMFFLNERPLTFEWCRLGLCDLSEVKKQYKEFTENKCDKYFCSGAFKPRITAFIFIAIVVLQLSFLVI